MGVRVGIDSGGTFTDLQAVDEHGAEYVVKLPSTPADPSLGFRQVLETLIERLVGDPSKIDIVSHGTTVAVNAILQGQFPPIGLLVTRGFRHILELARQTVPGERGAIYTWVKPPRLVPLGNVLEVTERLDFRGNVMEPFDDEDCRRAVRWFREQEINTVAVCFLNSYASGAHEKRAREIFTEEFPECFLSLSSETLPEYREYERAVTTCMNALLMPILGSYVQSLREHLDELRISAPLFIMKSGGGSTRADLVVEQPVYTALSGPAAAVAGMAWLGRGVGLDDLITFDMGGTSTDVSLVEGGEPALVTETEIGVYPIRAPAIDVISIGAGGGSIAWLAPGDRLRVGPRSAGADPGPACYGRGGVEPTITDADLFLGRLPTILAGGTVSLDRDRAEAALTEFGSRIRLSTIDAARGIIEICELNMADAIREVSVQKGRDPRLFTLVTAGGAGPLHACQLAELLMIPKVLIPRYPGVGCSLGALVSDVREDFVRTDIQAESAIDLDRVNGHYEELESAADEVLRRQGFKDAELSIVRSADLRYRGMRTELTVPVASGRVDEPAMAEIFSGLHRAHQSAYGYSYEGEQQVELVNLRVAGIGRLPEVHRHVDNAAQGELGDALTGTRKVFFSEDGWIEAAVYDRSHLAAGLKFEGPAIVEQYDSTGVIMPGQTVEVDAQDNLIVTTVAGKAAAGRPEGAAVGAGRT